MSPDDERLELMTGGLMTVEQVGEFLNLSRSKVYGLMSSGALRSCRIGRSRRIPRQAVLEFAVMHMSGAPIEVSHDR